MKKVGVLMGSDSDLPVVRKALDTLRAFALRSRSLFFTLLNSQILL